MTNCSLIAHQLRLVLQLTFLFFCCAQIVQNDWFNYIPINAVSKIMGRLQWAPFGWQHISWRSNEGSHKCASTALSSALTRPDPVSTDLPVAECPRCLSAEAQILQLKQLTISICDLIVLMYDAFIQ